MNLTHLNSDNNPTMVDISAKNITQRQAIASGEITMSESAFVAVKENSVNKGPVLQTAIIAAITAAKNTSQAIPMCHNLMLSKVDIRITELQDTFGFRVQALVKCEGKTGVEMEALHSVSIGLLTIYDMLKAIDKNMIIREIHLQEKSGGKSGDFLFKKI